ncbi:hypothetical protein [Demequina sp.]|uniref:hypothetical protein n=1 Tax=Demequina sp. TaxID=2050685 RepID=UPI003A851A6C
MTKTIFRQVMGMLLVGLVGLTMLFYGLERTSLVMFAEGPGVKPPMRVYVTLFVGLAIVNLCIFFALRQWSLYLRTNRDARQLPVWALLGLILCGGAALVAAIATHAGYVRTLETVPLEPNMGYVGFQVITSALVIIPLVLLGARWAPGYRMVPAAVVD